MPEQRAGENVRDERGLASRGNTYGRVLHLGDPWAPDFRRAVEEVDDIRRTMSDLRHRLLTLSMTVDRPLIPTDSTALMAVGALDCAVIALYQLTEGPRSYKDRAEMSQTLWDDVEENPKRYVVLDGRSER